jgi:succinyl-diaminopimelate desuccinylase
VNRVSAAKPERATVTAGKLDPVELLTELVATDSQNPGAQEREVARLVDSIARERGFDSRVVETAPERANVLVSIDAGGPRSLALSGHLDTKELGDAVSQWSTPPLELVLADGLAYGLGTSDMKGAVAAMLVAAERWADNAPAGRLDLVFTADEECGGEYGAKALSQMGLITADAVIVGEPSGMEEAWEAMHLVSRGICRFDVVIEGAQGHSGLSDRLPTSATVVASRAVIALHDRLEPSFEADPAIDSRPTVNAGLRLRGGVQWGVHPGSATVGSEIRLVPGMRKDTLEAEIVEVLRTALPQDIRWSLCWPEGPVGWKDAVGIEPAHPLVTTAQSACQEVLGRRLRFAAYPGATDATAFVQLAGKPTIASLGPGWLSVAHGANERVGVEQLHQAASLYEAIARNFLAVGE